MRRAASLKVFVIGLFAGVILLTLAWTRVSTWTSYPAGMLAAAALERTAPGWVREARLAPGHLEVDTSVAIATPQTGMRLAEITVESDPGRYAYGLPIFLALLLAARGPGRTARALAGYALLVPLQAFSLAMHLLMQLLLAAQLDVRALRVEQWQMEALVYGYQVGALVLPTLAPMVIWLWLDRQFVNEVVIEAWRRSLPVRAAAPVAAAPVPVPAPSPVIAQGASGEPAGAGPQAPSPAGPRVGGVAVSKDASAALPPRPPGRR
ncbi:exosortase H-associated membrane protein [Paracidovorax anthurii]|uniref:Uncharacterized protein n=1 Tax=Paracidovorax anthurii TaxID=78229 RepID=A0A328YQT3_9BURK|nr:exosortase H-associated membrane protein [Paracidovorax anthurii]RAR76199.1 hypothetical protein AX018_10528 [Paracidovorax anthurii]